jgi:hypothetical protein
MYQPAEDMKTTENIDVSKSRILFSLLLLVVLSLILNCQDSSSSLVDGWLILGPDIHIVVLCS